MLWRINIISVVREKGIHLHFLCGRDNILTLLYICFKNRDPWSTTLQ